MNPRLPVQLGTLCLASALLLGCQPPAPPPSSRVIRVGVAQITKGPSQPPVLTNGVITAGDELKLSFKVAGIVQKINVEEGQSVVKGQSLATLDLTEVSAQVEQARQLAEKGQRDLTRSTRLRADEVISEEELETLRTQSAVAQAALVAAKFNQDFARIQAPRDGRVLRKLAEEREFVGVGQPVLVLGPQAGGFILRAGLSDRDIVRLHRSDPATITVDALPGQVLTGRLSVLPAAASPTSGLFDIEVAIAPVSAPLVSGLAARLRLDPSVGSQSTLPYAPIGAVVEGDGDTASVFVVTQGVARRRAIRIAFITRDAVAIAAGLSPGETVVTDGALYLEDGEQVAAVKLPVATP